MTVDELLAMADSDNPPPLLLIEEPGLGQTELAREAGRVWSQQPVQDFSQEKLSMVSTGSGLSVSEATRLLTLKSDSRRTLILNLNGAGFEVQNALLKTLEEPPGSTWIILLADTDYPLLATVISRCRLVQAKPVSHEGMVEWASRKGLALPDEMVGAVGGNKARLVWLSENLDSVYAFDRDEYGVILAAFREQENPAEWVGHLLSALQGLHPHLDFSGPRLMVSSGVRPELVLAQSLLL